MPNSFLKNIVMKLSQVKFCNIFLENSRVEVEQDYGPGPLNEWQQKKPLQMQIRYYLVNDATEWVETFTDRFLFISLDSYGCICRNVYSQMPHELTDSVNNWIAKRRCPNAIRLGLQISMIFPLEWK